MSKAQFRILMLLTVVSGLVGGALSDLLFRGLPARAAQTTTAPKVIEAQEFRLVDEAGNNRAALAFNVVGNPALFMYDAEGELRLQLLVSEDEGAGVALYDGTGQEHVQLIGLGIEDGQPALCLWDAAQKQRATIGLDGDEQPFLELSGVFGAEKAMVTLGFDEHGRSLLNLHDACKTGAQLSSAPGLWLLDDTGKPQVGLNTAGGHGGALSLADAGGRPRASLMVLGERGRLSLFSDKGEPRVLLAASPEGAGLTICDAEGQERAVVGSTRTVTKRTGAETEHPESTITLLKENGDVLWRAP